MMKKNLVSTELVPIVIVPKGDTVDTQMPSGGSGTFESEQSGGDVTDSSTSTPVISGSRSSSTAPSTPSTNNMNVNASSSSSGLVGHGTGTVHGSFPSPLTGRISSNIIRASETGYPHFNASVMDGYAIDIDAVMKALEEENANEEEQDGTGAGDRDASLSIPLKFKVVERVHAGPVPMKNKYKKETIEGTSRERDDLYYSSSSDDLKAVYITTGAAIPSSFNCIIPVEQVDETYISIKYIRIDRSVLENSKVNQWIRPIGCDIKPHTTILSKGQVVETVHLGLLTQIGVQEVEVNCMPKVGILSTGNELMSHYDGTTCTSSAADFSVGVIPDANGPVLCSLLSSYGSCQPYHLGIAKDDNPTQLTSILRESIAQNDVVITTGGVSMGEMDIIEEVLVNNLNCQVHFGRLHMKPGKPTTFLTHQDEDSGKVTLIFALPGNPVSAMVCSELLVRPCLDMIHQGFSSSYGSVRVHVDDHDDTDVSSMVQNAMIHSEVHATLMNSVRLDMERPEYHRVSLGFEIQPDDGTLRINAMSTGVQRSSRLMSMCEASGLMMLPQGTSEKTMTYEGETYPVLLIRRPCGNTGMFSGIKVKDSSHLGNNAMMAVGIIEVMGSRAAQDYGEHDLGERLLDVMGDNEALIIQTRKVRDISSLSHTVREMGGCLDVIFVIGTDSSFVENLDISAQLRPLLTKENNAIASTVIQGAVQSEPLAPLFEPVMGYSTEFGCVLLSIPNNGLEDAVDNVKGLVKHALSKSHS